MSELNGAKIVSSAVLGIDTKTFIVNGKVYVVFPPTIYKICGAAKYLSEVVEAESMADIIKNLDNYDKVAHAVSWMVQGDDTLYDELRYGTPEEVVDGLNVCLELISTQNFLKLSALCKSVQELIAKPKL